MSAPLVPVVELLTTQGVICIELYEEEAPNEVASFLRLAMSDQLVGPIFSHLFERFVLVGRASATAALDTPLCLVQGDTAVDDAGDRLQHVGAGLVTCPMNPGKVGASVFYLTLSPQPVLDGVCRVFGRVYSGMGVVERISHLCTRHGGALHTPVVVERCSVCKLPRPRRPTARMAPSESSSPWSDVSVTRHAESSILACLP